MSSNLFDLLANEWQQQHEEEPDTACSSSETRSDLTTPSTSAASDLSGENSGFSTAPLVFKAHSPVRQNLRRRFKPDREGIRQIIASPVEFKLPDGFKKRPKSSCSQEPGLFTSQSLSDQLDDKANNNLKVVSYCSNYGAVDAQKNYGYQDEAVYFPIIAVNSAYLAVGNVTTISALLEESVTKVQTRKSSPRKMPTERDEEKLPSAMEVVPSPTANSTKQKFDTSESIPLTVQERLLISRLLLKCFGESTEVDLSHPTWAEQIVEGVRTVCLAMQFRLDRLRKRTSQLFEQQRQILIRLEMLHRDDDGPSQMTIRPSALPHAPKRHGSVHVNGFRLKRIPVSSGRQTAPLAASPHVNGLPPSTVFRVADGTGRQRVFRSINPSNRPKISASQSPQISMAPPQSPPMVVNGRNSSRS